MKEEDKVKESQLVAFVLEDEEFACDINDVREVLLMVKITPLPNALHFVEGVINLRGEVIPVIDLRKRFGLSSVERDDNSRIIIVEVSSKMVGLIVDKVSEVINLPDKQIQDAPEQLTGNRTQLIMGVGKIDSRLLIILNLELILSSDEQIALEDISDAGRRVAREITES